MHVDIDRFANFQSPIHRWELRCKILSLLGLLFVIASTRSLVSAALSLFIGWSLCYACNIGQKAFWQRIRWVLPVLGPVALILPFVPSEKSTLALVEQGVAILLRGAALMSISLPLLGTARIHDSFAAFRALGMPGKLATIFLFSYRYLFVFLDDLRKTRIGMKARAYKASWGIHSLRTTANHVGSLLSRSYERTTHIYHAMLVRAFQGEYPLPYDHKIHPRDLIKSSLVGAAMTLLLIGEHKLWPL